MTFRQLLLIIAIAGAPVLPPGQAHAQKQAPSPPPEAPTQVQQARQQLQDIQKSIQEKRAQVEQMRKQLARETDESNRRDLEWRIEREEADISNLRRSFENIVLGGVDFSVFDPERPDEEFDWKRELQVILKPLLQELKALTEKPRQIERLNSRLAMLENQEQIAERALNNMKRLLDDGLDKATRQNVEYIHRNWTRRLDSIRHEQEISRLQLDILQKEDVEIFVQIRRSINEFVTGRGFNLVLSIAAFLVTFFLMKGLYLLYYRLDLKGMMRTTTTGRRMIAYVYQALTVFMSILVALLVLYVLGDTLLLTLALIVLLVLLLGLRNYLPRFLNEAKLLLNIGAVRERERVIYNGLPWLVRSLGVYSRLYNPALEGLLRLPLSEMLELVSRPYRDDEPWFPTKTGDWVMMSDGTVGQVLRQTPEIVQLRMRGTTRTYTTTNFLAGEPRNLSEGFGVTITFGIDYRHQPISTTEIPQVLHGAIEKALRQSELGKHVENILVEFQDAGASALNYMIYVLMKGGAADSYYVMNRLLQRVCVDTCNERGWVIPFNQITLHAGTGLDAVMTRGKS